MKILKHILIIVIILLLCLYGLYKLSKSRTFQLFGGMVYDIQTDRQIVALTFDDGPTENTDKILEILSRHNIQASFYLVGEAMEEHMDLTKKIVDAGHQVGNHSYTHKRMIFKTPKWIQDEIEMTDELIRQVGYTGEISFRTPYGKRLLLTPYFLWKKKKVNVFFDVEPETYVRSAEDILAYTLGHTTQGDIILLHPMYGGEDNNVLQILDELIVGLQEKGFSFVTVDELMEEDTTVGAFW